MKKKILFLPIVLCLCASCSEADVIDVWTESSYVNVFRDFEKEEVDKAAFDLVVVCNEQESFQAVLRSREPFAIEKVVFKDLRSEKGRIKAENLDYHYVEYVYMGENTINQNENTLLRTGAGFYPDALSNDPTIEVAANEAQPVWMTLYVPKGTPAGLYTGKATIYTSLGKCQVDISAEVNDVEIPDGVSGNFDLMVHQQIAGTWWYEATRNSHPQDVIVQVYGHERWTPEWWELVGNMADNMKRSRMNVLFVNTQQLLLDGPGTKLENGVFTYDWSKFDEYVQFFLDKQVVRKLEGLHVGSVIGAVGKEFKSYILANNDKGELCSINVEPMSEQCRTFHTSFLGALNDHLKSKGWLEMWIQHVGDEAESELQHRQYAYYMEILKRVAPDMPCGDPTYALKSAFNAVAHGATIVTPIEDLYQIYKADFDKMQEDGTRIYVYNCCGPHYQWLGRMIDKPVWHQRSLGWLSYKWGISGWLFWGWNFWVDWFQQAQISVDDEAFKGDHYSVYPDLKNNKVKASIRTEAFRDMSEEFELLKIVGDKNPELALELVNKTAVDASDNYEKDPAVLNQVRTELIKAAAK